MLGVSKKLSGRPRKARHSLEKGEEWKKKKMSTRLMIKKNVSIIIIVLCICIQLSEICCIMYYISVIWLLFLVCSFRTFRHIFWVDF